MKNAHHIYVSGGRDTYALLMNVVFIVCMSFFVNFSILNHLIISSYVMTLSNLCDSF